MKLLSVNVGKARSAAYTDAVGGMTGVDKRPVEGPVRVFSPGPPGVGAGGVEGDSVCDLRFHGGDDRAVYAFAREDLDAWERELGRPLADGAFAENLTTGGVDVTGALIGERWRVGPEVVLEVTGGRIPCRTFQNHVGEPGWVKRFTRAGAPGALLRVIEPGAFTAGDPIEVVHRPDHDITVALLFRAATVERELLPGTLVAAEWMESGLLREARAYTAKYGVAGQ
ncbi:MOSC domain-containing protein [Streptomyces sp. NBC_01387]|uniref:MOSC domain-containing protein n=1 Tax=unclassified Streptomyces TaxID=2593676 RepID=UPI0020251690|nr:MULTISPECIES: MOSC domain-containing protein [unclassified Streptomyces]MCX4548816.1 MOSC domain-containing protein [Streptomyces sp. NBC_01500]WSC20402.1 MOSC domain-containing protein [Streptomyces sp. NBC_01766]WSV54435.1 MOSC domain-containing protein [Streptomyces sp. NBC_01014]